MKEREKKRGTRFSVPYGKTVISFELPPGMRGTVVSSRKSEPVADAGEAISQALARPINSKPLGEMARPDDRVCIVFTDITRASPDHLLVPALLKELARAGVQNENITLLCGIGMHRPSTREEKIAKLGADVVARYAVIDNEPCNPARLADLGLTSGGVPVTIHRAVVDADLLIATGLVEPHQYAGYSGGRKTVAIGAAGEELIAHTHGPAFVEHPGARLGKIEGNPFHEAISEAARRANLSFILNVVLDDDARILKVAAGEPEAAFRELVAFARGVYEVSVPCRYDVAIGGVGYPKDVNLYQASRAPSYLHFAPTPLVKPGGYYIIPARCGEGAGEGLGEQRFLSALSDSPDIRSVLDDARRHGYPPGHQRAFVVAKVLEQARVIIVGSTCPQVVAACKMIPAATVTEALAMAAQELGPDLDVLIVPHALLTLPTVAA